MTIRLLPAIRRRLAGVSISIFALLTSASAGATLDLSQAIRRALDADPRMVGAQLEIEATRGGVIQAAKRPNPELSVEIEDFLGSGDYRGFEKASVTISVQQRFERGGKRDARIAAAQGKEDVAAAEVAVTMREIITQTKIDFIAVLGAIQKLDLLTRSGRRFDELVPLLRRRVEMGASPPADIARGELSAGKARVMTEKARIELQAVKRQLVSNWAGNLGDAAVISGRLRHNGHPTMALGNLLPGLEEHPAVRIWASVYSQREGELRLQRATASPDLTLGLGVRRIFETDDTAIRAGGSIPLPIRDRNEGSIIEAERRLAKVEFDRQAALRSLQRRVIEAHGELEASCLEARRLAEAVLPVARRARDDVQQSFEQGRLGVKDLLDINRDLYEAEVQQLEADVRCHAAAAKVETLAARRPFAGWEAVTRR